MTQSFDSHRLLTSADNPRELSTRVKGNRPCLRRNVKPMNSDLKKFIVEVPPAGCRWTRHEHDRKCFDTLFDGTSSRNVRLPARHENLCSGKWPSRNALRKTVESF